MEAESEARATDQGWIRRVCSLAWHIGREDKLCAERLLLCNERCMVKHMQFLKQLHNLKIVEDIIRLSLFQGGTSPMLEMRNNHIFDM